MKKFDFDSIIGKRFTNLVIIREGEPHFTRGGNKHRTAIVVCDCGVTKSVQMSSIFSGEIKSCGCYSAKISSESAKVRFRKHGGFGTPEYEVWMAMKKRCFNENHKSYSHYGGRGITVCDRWKDSFENFLEDMGKRPSIEYSIERDDVNGNYEPSNCRWDLKSNQPRNTTKTKRLLHNGSLKTIAEISRETGISWYKINHGVFNKKMMLSEVLCQE